MNAAVVHAYDAPTSIDDDERQTLAKRACGDIPEQSCTVVDVEISARLYIEPVEQRGAGIDAVVRDMSGRD